MSSSNLEIVPDGDVFAVPPKQQTLPEILPAFSKFIRGAALSRFAYITKRQNFEVTENKNWDDFCYGSSMSVILVAGKDFKLFFKSHFHQKKYQQSAGSEIPASAINDVFREYANLSAGAIKRALQDLNVICGISLPNITSGYDELIFSDTLRSARIIDCFDVVSPNFKFTVTVTLDIGAGEVFDALKDIASMEYDDEIEFL